MTSPAVTDMCRPIASLDSCADIRRTRRIASPKLHAPASTSSPVGPTRSKPSCNSVATPANPTTTASQTETPTRSPSTGPDRIATHSGAVAYSVVASPTDSACVPSAWNSARAPPMPNNDLSQALRASFTRSEVPRTRATTIGTSAPTRKRNAAISDHDSVETAAPMRVVTRMTA